VDESKEGTYTPYTKWRWINVYNLIGSSIEQTNHKYLNFYKGKKKEYEALKKEAREKEIEAQRLGELCPGCEHSAYFYLEQVMDEYIERINKMIKDDLTGK
jgi:TPP-dependent indolepyruvate ferredoxin oxidoreductase alpha subunit